MRVALIFILIILTANLSLFAQENSVPTDSLIFPPISSVGVMVGYSDFQISGSFNLNSFDPKYDVNDKNDIYRVEGRPNYQIALFYEYYFGNHKTFALNGKISYPSRHAKLNARPRYLVRDPVTLDSAYLITETEINTNFNSFGMEISVRWRYVVDNWVFSLGAGPNLNFITNGESADYRAKIIGLENSDGITYRETDITFSNGTKEVSFNNLDNPILGKAIGANSVQVGLHLSFGVEWQFSKGFSIRYETSASGVLTEYFKNYSTGIIPGYVHSIGIQYSGLFE